MTLHLFISLPKKYDKEDATFERVPCQKNQKAIRISKSKEKLRIIKKKKEDPNQFFDWATPPEGYDGSEEPINILEDKPCTNCGVPFSLHYPTQNQDAPMSCHEYQLEKIEAGLEEKEDGM